MYLRRGSRIARIANTAKVVHKRVLTLANFLRFLKLARFLRIKLVLLEYPVCPCCQQQQPSFSTEKTVQRYTIFLTFANNRCIFLSKRYFFLHICVLPAFLHATRHKITTKNRKAQRFDPLRPN